MFIYITFQNLCREKSPVTLIFTNFPHSIVSQSKCQCCAEQNGFPAQSTFVLPHDLAVKTKKRHCAFWWCAQELQYLYNIFYSISDIPDFHLTTAIWYENSKANMVFFLFFFSSWLNQKAVYFFEHLLYCLCVLSHAQILHCGFSCRFRGINLNGKDCVLLYLVKLS